MSVVDSTALNTRKEYENIGEYGNILRQSLVQLQGAGIHMENRVANQTLRSLYWLRRNVKPLLLCQWMEIVWKYGGEKVEMETGTRSNLNRAFAEIFIDKVVEFIRKLSLEDTKEYSSTEFMPESWRDARPQVYCFLLLLGIMYAIDRKEVHGAWVMASAGVRRLMESNSRACDVIGARLYYFYALAAERNNKSDQSRPILLRAHRLACLHQDYMSQAALINCILRSYLLEEDYETARKFAACVSFPEEARSNAQHTRFQYYLGVVEAVRLNYSESHNRLEQAMRKMIQSETVGLGIRLSVTKFAIVVEMLMGDIPSRQIFNQKALRKALIPYFYLVSAVRSGDIESFSATLEKYEKIFKRDRTYNLIARLHLDVIRAGLRMLCDAYSRIPLQQVAATLKLKNPEDAEAIIAKAITDGIVDVSIDSKQGILECCSGSIQQGEQIATFFCNKIQVCHRIQAEARNAMHYPSKELDYLNTDGDERRGGGIELDDDFGVTDDMDLL